MEFKSFVVNAVLKGASDIHLSTGSHPAVRTHGKVKFYDELPVLTNETVLQCAKSILSDNAYKKYLETGDVDGAASIEDCGRFRVNVFKQLYGTSLVMRVVNAQIPDMRSLNLPQSLSKVLSLKEGLVLVTGPTGSGKTTTLAAIINEINKKEDLHIITIEDPIEYVHKSIKCIVNQREIGRDSKTFHTALRAVLREDPDVILMGEIRDLESMNIALSAAETGHLVFATLHTEGAAKTIDRLIDMFPTDRQQQGLGQISTTLKCVISQRLLPRADIKGRIGAFEIMFVNAAIANLIRENKIAQMEQIMQLNKNTGMITRNASIQDLLECGFITSETADKYRFTVDASEDVLSANVMRSKKLF